MASALTSLESEVDRLEEKRDVRDKVLCFARRERADDPR